MCDYCRKYDVALVHLNDEYTPEFCEICLRSSTHCLCVLPKLPDTVANFDDSDLSDLVF